MLTSVDVTNSRGATLQLPLASISSGYSIRDIEGLDPVDAVLTSSSLAQMDGAEFQNARRDIRNITMKLGLEPDYMSSTVQSLRSALYGYLLPKSTVSLAFYIDGVKTLLTSGWVETFANALFSADPEVDVSIVCYDPDFYGPSPVTLSTNTFSGTGTIPVNYPGTSDAGIIFTLNINRIFNSGFTIYNTRPDNTLQKFIVTGGFVSGDVVTVNTIPGSKAVTLKRSGLTTSILYDVDPTSSWISLQNGINRFSTVVSGGAIPYTMVYVPKFGGI